MLALFALAAQIVLSCTHYHSAGFHMAAGRGSLNDLTTVAVNVSEQPQHPVKDHPNAPPHETCPLCAALHAVGTPVLSAQPAISAPVTGSSLMLVSKLAPFVRAATVSIFDPRAPPAA